MRPADPAPRREPLSTRWVALAGALCALLLATLAGVCVSSGQALERTGTWRTSIEGESQRKDSLSASLPGRQERLVGTHEPSAPGHFEPPRPTSKPPPPHLRAEPYLGPPSETDARRITRTRMYLASVLPARHGHLADRPVIANCPTRGPPRRA